MGDRILVVDDSATIQKIFRIAFSRYEVDVTSAGSFVEAVNDLSQSPPDMLVVDANLHGVKGPEDFVKLKDLAPNAPVLLLVGSHEHIDEDSYRAKGFEHFLHKPFEAQDIVKKTALVLQRELGSQGDAQEATLASPPPPPPPKIEVPDLTNVVAPAIEVEPPPIGIEQLPPIGVEVAAPPPPPPPVELSVDGGQHGKRAFDDAVTVTSVDRSALEKGPGGSGVDQEAAWAEIKERLESFLSNEAPVIVRKTVESYCESHFSELARAVLTAEIRRLADEKARLLVDS